MERRSYQTQAKPLMKFTIRRMMLAIAVFTIALYVGLSYRQSGVYRRQAQFYAHAGDVALVRARNVESGWARLDGYTAEERQKAVVQARRFAAYAARMKSKYDRATFLPWVPIATDPPLPGPP
jgi:hypothetical protein